ncbi:hypothetical protein EHF33_01970 [Deinococcus psychrotolerans]|uniref:Uncharacterized protein n=1 Tax=Deinococcus psychrotolerans TaxID=2489213 RepID=A0A3G8YKR1_9DEIO|nr:hypothetical protein [Deinococcus psychrotolerans]AZI41666.1 hypothetical protein EHF33_01970 [Deinococcus psychrotolerans]
MRVLGLSGSSWVAVVIAALILSLMSEAAFVQVLPEKLIITAVTVVLSTALFRLLLRQLPNSQFSPVLRRWLG